jgi:hypothetical protein
MSDAPSGSDMAEAAKTRSLATTDPFGFLTDEVKNSYLRCSYKWSFHHIPNLLIAIRERRLDPLLVWAMLAITVRYSIITAHLRSHS